jgi:hypothetical protein
MNITQLPIEILIMIGDYCKGMSNKARYHRALGIYKVECQEVDNVYDYNLSECIKCHKICCEFCNCNKGDLEHMCKKCGNKFHSVVNSHKYSSEMLLLCNITNKYDTYCYDCVSLNRNRCLMCNSYNCTYNTRILRSHHYTNINLKRCNVLYCNNKVCHECYSKDTSGDMWKQCSVMKEYTHFYCGRCDYTKYTSCVKCGDTECYFCDPDSFRDKKMELCDNSRCRYMICSKCQQAVSDVFMQCVYENSSVSHLHCGKCKVSDKVCSVCESKQCGFFSKYHDVFFERCSATQCNNIVCSECAYTNSNVLYLEYYCSEDCLVCDYI